LSDLAHPTSRLTSTSISIQVNSIKEIFVNRRIHWASDYVRLARFAGILAVLTVPMFEQSFLSTFSGTQYASHRTVTAIGFHF
jgi:hypothetical protein